VRLGEILDWSARLSGCDHVPEDSQVYVEADADVRRVLFGVDIDVGELLYARDAGYDAVIAHHPCGEHARMDFAKVVERQIGQMGAEGISESVARAAVEARLAAVHRRDHMSNYNQLVDTARLIGVPFCNIHLACDILGRQAIVDRLAERAHPEATIGDAIAWIEEFPEMEAALTRPEAWLGLTEAPIGRYTVAMAGGTNGGHPVFREYFRHGVDTVFAMHIAEDDLARLRAEFPSGNNLVVTGHMASDSIGINRVIDGLAERGIEVTRTAGVIAGR
jgi:putative NIF3 family GTP cyclohydrolase 1 type 2